MSETWRARGNPDYEGCNDEYEVKPPSLPKHQRDEEISGSSSRHHSSNEDRPKHRHKSHKKDKRKSKSPSNKRKRSRSRSRDKEDYKSYDKRERHSRDSSRDRPFRSPEDRYHDSRRMNRIERYRRYKSETEERQRDRGLPSMRNNEDPSKNIPEANNLNQLQTTSKNQPTEAAKLKEEIERRKLLWGKKDKPAQSLVPPVWKQTAFSDDSDGKVSEKFKRLMGMKRSDTVEQDSQSTNSSQESDLTKQNQEYLANLEKQYEVARATTHTQRGLGLGFSSRLWPR